MTTDKSRADALTDEMIDAARPLFLALECGAKSIESVREYFENSGSPVTDSLPEWFKTGSGHLTKAGKAIVAWHAMSAMRPVEQHEAAPCVHADDPKGCYRVRCQLGNKCIDDDMSPREVQHEAAPTCKACGDGECFVDGDARCRHTAQPEQPAADERAAFDIIAHLQRQREFSERTFGPGARTAGVCDHIRKELKEIEANPADLTEWIDVVILALDGAWRAGGSPQQIIDALVAKQTKNEGRTWPDWRTVPADKAIEHDRTHDACPQCQGKGTVVFRDPEEAWDVTCGVCDGSGQSARASSPNAAGAEGTTFDEADCRAKCDVCPGSVATGGNWPCARKRALSRASAANGAESPRGTDAQILFERKLTCEAINGAMAFGYQNTNPPPSADHWLAPFWHIGRKQAELEVLSRAPRTDVAGEEGTEAVAWVWGDTIYPEHSHSTAAEAIEEGWIPLIYGDPKAVQVADEQRSKIEAAIKATEYKYFGSYEFTEAQHDAVDVLVEAARTLLSAPRIALQPPSADAAATPAYAQPTARRSFEIVCDALGRVTQALGLAPDDASAEPILAAINELKVRAELPAIAPADAQAVEAVATPFGWAQPKGGNYFTRSEVSAKRVGGLVPVYLAPPPPAPASARTTDDELWDQTLRERDEYHEAADKLAAAIAKHFGVDIGEHSNVNCPWNEALEVIENAVSASAPFGLTDEQRSVITQAADYLGHDQDAFALAFDLRALLKGDKQ